MKILAQVTVYIDRRGMRIDVHDVSSGVTFLRLAVDQDKTCALLGHQAMVYCDTAEVLGLDHVGKRVERKDFEFEFEKPVHADGEKWDAYMERVHEAAGKAATLACPDGWHPWLYFGSRDSFYERDGRHFAHISILRYHETTEEERMAPYDPLAELKAQREGEERRGGSNKVR